MQTIVLSPNTQFFPAESMKILHEKYSAIVHTQRSPSVDLLLSSSDEKIILLDPDFYDWEVSAQELSRWKNVSAVLLQTTSHDWVDGAYLAELGIPLLAIPNYSSNAVAESVCASSIILARGYASVFSQTSETTNGIFDILGKSMGIIGLGSIGSSIAEKAQALGMRVSYWSAHSRNEKYHLSTLEEIFATSDFIVPALAFNETTQGLITDELLDTMKKTACFISVTPKIFNHELLIEMAENQRILGYSYEYEAAQPRAHHKGNVLALPANAFATDVSSANNMQIWMANLDAAAAGSYPHRVN